MEKKHPLQNDYISGKQLAADYSLDAQQQVELLYAGDLTAYRLVSTLEPFYPSMNPPYAGCENPKPYPEDGLLVSTTRKAEYQRIPAADVGQIDVIGVLGLYFDIEEVVTVADVKEPEHEEPPVQAPQKGQQQCSLCRSGAGWILEMNGRSYSLKNKIGVRYLAQLIQNPGQALSVLDLGRDPAGSHDPATAETLSKMEDMTAEQLEEEGLATDHGYYESQDNKKSIEKEINTLRDYMQEEYDKILKAQKDDEDQTLIDKMSAKFEKEKNILLNEKKIKTIINKDGQIDLKPLKQLNPEAEKVRESVTKRLREVIKEIEGFNDHELSEYLSSSIKMKNLFCTYLPEGDAPAK